MAAKEVFINGAAGELEITADGSISFTSADLIKGGAPFSASIKTAAVDEGVVLAALTALITALELPPHG